MKLRIKHHSLTGRITTDMVYRAWRKVRGNRGAAGIDRVSVAMFEANLDQNLAALLRDLKTGSFQPLPLRRVYLDKGQGQQRPLGIPAVRDRVAQDVLRQLLSPLFEPLFHDASFGFRPRRNCQQAVQRVLEHRRAGYLQVLDADIQGFFDNLPHATLLQQLRVVMRGVANYFATSFSNVVHQFRTLDRWLRMRLRCMRKKRKWHTDNWRLHVKHLRRLGAVFLSDFLDTLRSKVPRGSPLRGNLTGVARCPKGACR